MVKKVKHEASVAKSKSLSKPRRSIDEAKVRRQDKTSSDNPTEAIKSRQGKARYSQTASQDKRDNRKGGQGATALK